MLKIGDWVTQYSSGYWKVLNILPKYADSDYSYNGNMWQKGDRLGDWVILKKGFTPQTAAQQRLRMCGRAIVQGGNHRHTGSNQGSVP